MSSASPQFRALARRTRGELERILAEGEAPSIASLVGHEYRGYNVPRMASLLGTRTFIKLFFVDATSGEAFGANSPVRQNGLDGAWVARPDENRPRRYAFFGVPAVDRESSARAYPDALLLDYGRGGNRAWGVACRLRDYLVRAQPGSDELLLGKAYLALGPARVPVGFFVLERRRPLPAGEQLSRQR